MFQVRSFYFPRASWPCRRTILKHNDSARILSSGGSDQDSRGPRDALGVSKGWGSFQRQTPTLSQHPLPEINPVKLLASSASSACLVACPRTLGKLPLAVMPGNPRREILLTAALGEITSRRSGQIRSTRQAHPPRYTSPSRSAEPEKFKSVAATIRPN